MFELFDQREEFIIRCGSSLPHWYQPGVTYFVTFRTDDSVPQSLSRSWHGRRDHWLRKHDIDPTAENWKLKLQEDPDLEQEFNTTFTREFMDYLDRGYGACALRERSVAEVIANSLRHFDGARYWLGDFVIMPNHVHVLACLIGSTDLEMQCNSWKSYSAREVNRILGRNGRFWQEESFDHLVRSPDQFEYLRHYIAENPKKANLPQDSYLHHIRPK
jgi:putative transposase